ncbi:MAG: clostripain-related cysteine peptidase, partial [Clostridia bacterium]|nr:clostripain-related cysteine peptidase [Clostridia bacterium]
MENRPRGREKNVTGQGKDIYKRGSGLGTGPVGSSSGHAGSPGNTQYSGTGPKRTTRGGKGSLLIILLVLLFGGGGAGLSGLLGGSSEPVQSYPTTSYTQPAQQQSSPAAPQIGSLLGGSSGASSGGLSSLLGGFSGSNVSTGWDDSSYNEKLDTSVASGARAKRTQILGGGRDTVTIMVYMCGTDLESKNGMATADLSEMARATIGSNVNLIVMTGGCKKWNNNIVSNKVNQIYKVEDGGLRRLSDDFGTASMTTPSTLSSYIQWCKTNYPANRNMLIFWDHGGGSLSGYGYDEKHATSGSMNLKGINQALKDGGMTFDFIGFDACLMATTENALMLTNYADYLIASEETEPGVGWYYTNWLTSLSQNTSMPTIEIGRQIVDDFVTVCAQTCQGQKTTLSVVDLAELEATLPKTLTDFSVSTCEMLQGNDYQKVSDARSGAREFSPSNRIDQVDLVSLAKNLGTPDAKALAQAILNAVKYNRTSSNMTNAYGLSIYFPYKKV